VIPASGALDLANEQQLDYKMRMKECLEPVFALLDEARSRGLLIRWDGLATDQLGHSTPLNLRVEKHY
jgi:hypothetical protein